jgi:hypothetical protein
MQAFKRAALQKYEALCNSQQKVKKRRLIKPSMQWQTTKSNESPHTENEAKTIPRANS